MNFNNYLYASKPGSKQFSIFITYLMIFQQTCLMLLWQLKTKKKNIILKYHIHEINFKETYSLEFEFICKQYYSNICSCKFYCNSIYRITGYCYFYCYYFLTQVLQYFTLIFSLFMFIHFIIIFV